MRIPGTRIEVDNFYPADASHYALTHYHADHRRGLRKGDVRPILCSRITKRLLVGLRSVPCDNIIVIDHGDEIILDGHVRIRAFDANHCPGALMFLFSLNGLNYLHTGDFRYCASHDAYPELFQDIDTLYIDSTYKSEENLYDHPPQEEAIDDILSLIEKHPDKTIYIGLYQIGKNRIIQSIFERLRTRVYVTKEQKHIYSLMGMDEAVTTDASETRIKGYSMHYFYRNFKLAHPDYRKDSIVIIPTGWSNGSHNNNGFFYIPYSEHNSSQELRKFIDRVKPANIVETNI
ncbi:MAG: hypothetical protein JW807_12640 [Spirochaetes bacterium]|nr:hypothetical protein [Spirochaetota bacterium]